MSAGPDNGAPASKKPSKTAKAGTSRRKGKKSDHDFVEGDRYAPAPESSDQVSMKDSYDLFIGGEWVRAPKRFETINPATEEVLAEVTEAGPRMVDRAVTAARNAHQKTWSGMPGRERGKYLFRLARLIQERAREFAVLESMDGGKPIRESRDIDLPLVSAHFFYYAGWADKLDYAFPGRSASPLGVVGQVIPWNFPLLMAAWKLAPALACGNTVVLKPAETTPLTALKLAELIEEAGFPPGVVNVITGGGKTGQHLVQHAGIDKVAFTGSTAVGKLIQKSLAGTGKRFTLELGGKAANVIFDDAPVNQAVEGIVNGIFFNQGHVCCAGSRLFVQEGIADTVVRKLKRRMESLVLGDPLDKNTDVGAINSPEQLGRIQGLVDSGTEQGAKCWQSGQKVPRKGFWFKPTIFTECAQSHRIVQEEVFGPVLAIQTFRTPEEAVEKANNTPYGLSGGVWTDKGSKIFRITSQIRAGVLWANTFNKFDPCAPFGGYKESGIGREGGIHGLSPYVELG